MSVTNLSVHLECTNYEKDDKKTVELLHLSIDIKWTTETTRPLFLFILEGELTFNCDSWKECLMHKGEFVFIPEDTTLIIQPGKTCLVMIVRLENYVELCDCPQIRKVVSEKPVLPVDKLKEENRTFVINDELSYFLQGLHNYISAGIKCRYFLNLKVRELLYILYYYYPREELVDIFHPSNGINSYFERRVKKISHKFKTAAELAVGMHYSPSGFQKKFKKVFGVAPYQWMKEQRTKILYKELRYGNKNFKEICDLMGFSSTSYLNDYCRENFGKTPGEIRNSPIKGINP